LHPPGGAAGIMSTGSRILLKFSAAAVSLLLSPREQNYHRVMWFLVRPRKMHGASPDSTRLDFNPPGLGRLGLGQSQAQFAIIDFGLDLGLVHNLVEGELAPVAAGGVLVKQRAFPIAWLSSCTRPSMVRRLLSRLIFKSSLLTPGRSARSTSSSAVS
jgi:hypothetical protein